MKRREALEAILAATGPRDRLFFANGRISREALFLGDRPNHFYMLASMGHAPSIALGAALARPCSGRTVVVDGDGNLLMNLASLPTTAALAPGAFVHIVLDNGVYATTGHQPTVAPGLDLTVMARAAGFDGAARADTPEMLHALLADVPAGTTLLHVPLERGDVTEAPIPPLAPETIRERFEQALLDQATEMES